MTNANDAANGPKVSLNLRLIANGAIMQDGGTKIKFKAVLVVSPKMLDASSTIDLMNWPADVVHLLNGGGGVRFYLSQDGSPNSVTATIAAPAFPAFKGGI